MASTYALPASAMAHNHGHHGHVHSHSHSPGRAYSSRGLRQERSNGSLHSHSQSEIQLPQSHNHDHDHSHAHSHSHSHSHSREPSPASYLPTPPNSTSLPPVTQFGKPTFELSPPLSSAGIYEPHLNDVNVIPHIHDHHGDHLHPQTPAPEPRSRFTNMILPLVLRWPLLHTIMAEKDSRRIFYFMSLNFAFMLVQACYGFLTDSLGLLSDSIHMFFDCLALGVGLFAAIASKWPPSERFPYGFGKIESLSGFGNGVFLMLISVEIMIEAIERLADGRETKRLGELFVVSAMGLAVNLVGMACFGHHGHAGHDHGGHSHDHGHSAAEKPHAHDCHNHDHGHDHKEHDHDHGHDHSHDSLMSQSPSKKAVAQGAHSHSGHSHAGHSHAGHSHSHDNENMHGIFLHVLADTMGSAAVMVSTGLIYLVGWNGWDPLASCVIAVLIFLSSIPLIKSCAKKLLLTVPDQIEYTLRETLAGVSDLRGVACYTVPRFWLGDKNTDSESEQVLGVMHIVATRGSDLDDVRERARDFLLAHSIDVVVQVEGSDDAGCWCGASSSRSPSLY